MDLVSHALIGAATASLIARPAEVRVAAFVGAMAGVLPDADALIRSGDPLLYIEYHRHFTHSFVFIPAGALLAAGLLWPLIRKSLSFRRVYLFCLLGIALHGMLDAATSYGTQLLWPFADWRVAWSVIAVFDPLFTLLVAIPVVLSLRRIQPKGASVALLAAAMYLAIGSIQHRRAESLLRHYATQQGLHVERAMVKPTLGNLMLWRGVVATPTGIHVAAVRPAFVGEDRVYPGESARRFRIAEVMRDSDTRWHNDLRRFAFFTDDLLSATAESNRIGDARYAMLPDSLRPIWSIHFDPAKPDRHVELIVDRHMSAAERKKFIAMLMGE